MKKVRLEQVSVQPFEGKFGPTNKVGIKVKNKNGEDQWINGFMKNHPSWQQGDEVELEIFQKEYNGKQYWNFKEPKKEDVLEQRVSTLESEVKWLKGILRGKQEVQQAAEAFGGTVVDDSNTSTPVNPEDKGINVNEIPF